jgi:hypothetical protein
MRSLHNPPPCLEARIGFPLRCLLAPRFNVRSIMPTAEKPANVVGVVPFVKADVLLAMASWLRTFDGNAAEGCFKKFDVVRIRAAYFNTQRHAATVGKHRPLGSQLATIGRVFPGFFPHPAAISSSPRPRFASSTGCPAVHRTPVAPPSTTLERRQRAPTLENNDARCSLSHTHMAQLSTGIQYVAHKKCHRQHSAGRYADGPPRGSSDSVATGAAFAPTIHPANAKRTDSVVLPLKTPPCGIR